MFESQSQIDQSLVKKELNLSSSSIEEEQKDRIGTEHLNSINYSPMDLKHRSIYLLQQPIQKRFSNNSKQNNEGSTPGRKKISSFDIVSSSNEDYPRKNTNTSSKSSKFSKMIQESFINNSISNEKHSRKSVLNNIDDFFRNFDTENIKNCGFSSFKPNLTNPIDKIERINHRKQILYEYLQDFMVIDMEDDQDNEEMNEIKKEEQELNDIPILYKQKIRNFGGIPCEYLMVAKMNDVEKLKEDFMNEVEISMKIRLKRGFMIFCTYVSWISKKIVRNTIFQISILLIIILNALTYSLIKNRSGKYETYSDFLKFGQDFFFVFYIIEMTLKIFAYGLILNQNSYFRDGWNILDFSVIIGLILTRSSLNMNLDVSLLRLLRLLIPLKTTSHFLELQIILSVLFSALPLLIVAGSILAFFYLFCSISGLQMFSGLLKQRCFNEFTGFLLYNQKGDEVLCGNFLCPKEYLCGKLINNPYFNVVNFDNILYSLLQTLFIVTLDNWTNIMYSVQKTYTNFAWIFFLFIIIIGNYFLMNLTLAVIKVKFSENHQNIIASIQLSRRLTKAKTYFDLFDVKREGKWISRDMRNNKNNKSKRKSHDKSIGFYLLSLTKNFFNTQNINTNKNFTKTPRSAHSKYSKSSVSSHTHQSLLENNSKIRNKYRNPYIKGIKNNFLQLFNLQRRNFVRRKSHKIDLDSDSRYLKIKINHSKKYSDFNIEDVFEIRKIRENEFNKSQKKLRKESVNVKFNLKKNKNYFLDFLNYLKKKKHVNLKPMRGFETISSPNKTIKSVRSLKKTQITSTGANLKSLKTQNSNTSTINKKESFQDLSRKSSTSQIIPKSNIPVRVSRRMNDSIIANKTLVSHIEEGEAFVLTYRNSGLNTMNRSSYFLNSFQSPKTRDSSPLTRILNKFKNGKSYKTTDYEYTIVRELIKNPIDVEEEENKKEKDEGMNFNNIYNENMNQAGEYKITWSGQDILAEYNLDYMEKLILTLNEKKNDEYLEDIEMRSRIFSSNLKKIVETKWFETFFVYAIISNIILLSSLGLISNDIYSDSDFIFTIIFSLELVSKLISYKVRTFFKDIMNKLDTIILFTSYMEIFIEYSSYKGAYYLRFLTAFKVLRILRMYKRNKFIALLSKILKKTISSYIYMLILLILFNFVYSIIGMQLFGGTFTRENSAFNFDTFWASFLSVFNIITLDNWIDLIVLQLSSQQGNFISFSFTISWIFIGNFVILNLFLAILLDSFTQHLLEKASLVLIDDDKEERSEDHLSSLKFIVNKEEGELIINELSKFKGDAAREFANNININKFIRKPSSPKYSNKRRSSFRSNIQTRKLDNLFCEHSFYIFSKSNKFRVMAYKIISHKYFENFMVWTIFFSSLLLALRTYLDENDVDETKFIFLSNCLNLIFCIIFIIDVILQSITNGFLLDRRSYLRDLWNILDFLMAISYFVDILTPDNTNSNIIQFFKVLKIFRPLKFITINSNIQLVVKSLLKSTIGITNVFVLVLTIWMIFAILGIILFRDRFGYCDLKIRFNINKEKCLANNNTWIIDVYNFENIFNSFLTLFIVSTLDGWSSIMNTAVNSDLPTIGPNKFNNEFSSYAFFLIFILFGVMFLVNLFIGVIFFDFISEQKRLKNKFLTESQLCWIKIQKLLIYAEPYFKLNSIPENKYRRFLYLLFNNTLVKCLFYCLIIFDLILLSLTYDTADFHYKEALETLHLVLNLCFFIETSCKIFSFGIHSFFYQNWEKLELIVFVSIILDIIQILFYETLFSHIKYIARIIKGLRILKMLRLVKLLKKIKSIQKLLQTLKFSIPMALNITGLLLLIYYIFVLFGCHYFRNITNGKIIDEYINFKNFSYTLMTLYKVSTADGWENIMFDVMDHYSWSYFYFILFYFITTNLMINLFILVLINQYEEYHASQDNPFHSFDENLEKFRNLWSKFTHEYKGIKINKTKLIKFMLALRIPMGFAKFHEYDYIYKEIMKMRLKIDYENCIYFNDLLFSSMKRAYTPQIMENPTDIALRKIENAEKKSLVKLDMHRKNYMTRIMSKSQKIPKINVKEKMKEFNPLCNFLFARISFNIWKIYSEKIMFKILNEADNYSENSSNSSLEDKNKSGSIEINSDSFKTSKNLRSPILPSLNNYINDF